MLRGTNNIDIIMVGNTNVSCVGGSHRKSQVQYLRCSQLPLILISEVLLQKITPYAMELFSCYLKNQKESNNKKKKKFDSFLSTTFRNTY